MIRHEFRDLADPEEVEEAIASLRIDPAVEEIELADANGRTLARRIDAPIDVSGFDRAAMDGYAVRAADTVGASPDDPVSLSVVGTLVAGEKPDASVSDGEAVRIATGAVVPPGADAVVPVERVLEGDSTVAVTRALAPGDSVSPRGTDVAAGDRALGPGTFLGPRHVGLLAALGLETVPVRRKPVVGILATGDELVRPGDPLRPEAGQIYDVNSYSIAAGVTATGCAPLLYESAGDDEADLRDALESAADCDLLLTAGSTSAGTTDVLHRLVRDEGDVLVHGAAIKPGRPLLVGRVFGTPYVGLPGYPVSALSVFRTLVAPKLREASGRPDPAAATVEATLATRVRYDGGRLRLLPVGLVDDGDGSFIAYAPAKGSGATTTLVEADGVVTMEPGTSLLPAGSEVSVERFDDAPIPALLGVGDPDPVFLRLLDALDSTRYLSLGVSDGRRWLRDGISDVLVTAPSLLDDDVDCEPLARWTREWGLVVARNTPTDVAEVADLLDGGVRFANLTEDLALRSAFDQRLAALDVDDPASRIDGYGEELPGIESAARSVDSGGTVVGLGLRATADRLDLPFVSVGRQRLAAYPNPTRLDATGVSGLRTALADRLDDLLETTPGYES